MGNRVWWRPDSHAWRRTPRGEGIRTPGGVRHGRNIRTPGGVRHGSTPGGVRRKRREACGMASTRSIGSSTATQAVLRTHDLQVPRRRPRCRAHGAARHRQDPSRQGHRPRGHQGRAPIQNRPTRRPEISGLPARLPRPPPARPRRIPAAFSRRGSRFSRGSRGTPATGGCRCPPRRGGRGRRGRRGCTGFWGVPPARHAGP